MLENILGSEIHMRMRVVCCTQNVITKSLLTDGYRDSRQDERIQATNLEMVDHQK